MIDIIFEFDVNKYFNKFSYRFMGGGGSKPRVPTPVAPPVVPIHHKIITRSVLPLPMTTPCRWQNKGWPMYSPLRLLPEPFRPETPTVQR